MSTIMATWLSTNEKVEDGDLSQKGLNEENENNQGYLAEYQ